MSFKPFKADFQTNGSNWCPNFGQSFVFYLNFCCKLWIEVLKVKNSRLPCAPVWLKFKRCSLFKVRNQNFSNHQTKTFPRFNLFFYQDCRSLTKTLHKNHDSHCSSEFRIWNLNRLNLLTQMDWFNQLIQKRL